MEGEEKSPLVESVGNLTSMLSPSTEIKPRRRLAYILVTSIINHRRSLISVLGLSMEVRFPTDSTRGDFSSPSLRSSLPP